MPARTGVQRGDELKTRWGLRLARGACDRDATGFERLARRFQNIAVEPIMYFDNSNLNISM